MSPVETLPRLRIESLRCSHGGPFSLQLHAGECMAITGRSGSGKSVLLRLIADLDPHDGEAWLDGRARADFSAPQWRCRVVYQAAEPAWWATTPREHMVGPGRAALAALLPALELDPALLDADVTRLSTGERQRLALVRSLALAPAVLLLDEPTASLDEASIRAVEAVLALRVRDGLAVLFVTHSAAQAERVATRRLEVRDGRLHPA